MLDAARAADGSHFVDLLWATGLAHDILTGKQPYTLIVPTNDAFKKLSLKLRDKLSNTCYLRRVLSHHIVRGKVSSSSLIKDKKLDTMQVGAPIYYNEYNNVSNIIFVECIHSVY